MYSYVLLHLIQHGIPFCVIPRSHSSHGCGCYLKISNIKIAWVENGLWWNLGEKVLRILIGSGQQPEQSAFVTEHVINEHVFVYSGGSVSQPGAQIG